ncbi:MAG: UDP-3-O-(3-hydroxymyristoyl)glucosamine N-acyltransferase [Deltaproteobacteria bacterium]|nr:UDP-3-O-(3-hydroxymyristoyl)glucosamine N-acyltransferase [Deltaproteobacteria bacterium]
MYISEITRLLSASFIGKDIDIKGISTIEEATSSDITFLSNPKYRDKALHTKAGAIIVKQELKIDIPQIIVDNVYLAFARVVDMLCPAKRHTPGISKDAYVHTTSKVDTSVAIYPHAYIGAGAKIGPNCIIYPGCFVGEEAAIGDNTILYPNVVVYDGCEIGKDCIIHSGVVIGSDGFGFVWDGGRHFKVPQRGKVIICDDVEIGSNCTIDRAALTTTYIGSDVKMDNLVQIGHNVTIGDHTIIVAQTGIAGSAHIGKSVILAGQVGVAGHITIGDGCIAGARAGIASDLPPGKIVSGLPAIDHKLWLRAQNIYKKLPDLLKRIKAIERRLENLEKD